MPSSAGRLTNAQRFPAGRFWAAGLAALLALAGAPQAMAQAAGQRAGQVTAAIPAGWLERPGVRDAAAPGLPVLWDDLLTTEARGRARITLDDGSILNVGSASSLRVVQHDATTRETELVLTYGQMRVRTRKLTEPGSKFTINTPTAVLGVIGSDVWIFTDGVRTWVIVFEGALSITGIVGGVINVGAGQQGTAGANQPPSGPSSPSQADYNNAINDTNVGDPLPQPPGPRGLGFGPKVPWIVGIAAVAAVVIGSIVVNRGKKEPPPPSGPPSDGGGRE